MKAVQIDAHTPGTKPKRNAKKGLNHGRSLDLPEGANGTGNGSTPFWKAEEGQANGAQTGESAFAGCPAA